MEDALIVLIVFGFALLAIKLILDYARDKHRVRASADTGSSLTQSELRMIVQDAVEDALDERFGRLERRLEKMQAPRLTPASSEAEADIEGARPASPPVQRDFDSIR